MNKILYFLSNYDLPSTDHKDIKDMKFEELMLYYVKKVCGYNADDKPNRKFYNESEWRYIPPISKEVHLEIIMGSYIEKEKVKELSIKTERCKLLLKPEDIAYIIVKEEAEVKQMINFLNSQFASHRLLEQLFSRIITVKQIKEDF